MIWEAVSLLTGDEHFEGLREIESERETAYLLKSQTMKDRLLQAAHRQTGLSFEAAVEKPGV